MSAFAGAGVHHIALSTPDAVAAMARLDGASMLVIPANYYEDLAARVALDDEALATLERLGLLYDQDAQGEFRHAYTDAFEDRFFFEIVERAGGYAGFGAPNAAVRMAAQARQTTGIFVNCLLPPPLEGGAGRGVMPSPISAVPYPSPSPSLKGRGEEIRSAP